LWEELGVPLTARAPWLRTYLAAFPRQQPVVVEVEEHGRPVAVGCLGRVDGPIVEWTALGIGVSDYAALAAVDGDAARRLAVAIAELVQRGRRPWRLRLEQLPAGDPALNHLRSLLPQVFCRPGITAPQLALTEPRTLERHLSRNGRRTLNKGWNRLRRDGHDVTVRLLRDPVEVAAALDAVVGLRRARDRQLGRGGYFHNRRFECFFRRAALELADRGQAEFTTMYVGDELIGYTLGLRDGGSYRLWDGRVAVDWLTYSTGRLSDALAVTSALADPCVTTLDWMRGEHDYKKHATTHTAEYVHLHAWSSSTVRHGYRVGSAIARRVRLVAAPGGLRRTWRHGSDRVRGGLLGTPLAVAAIAAVRRRSRGEVGSRPDPVACVLGGMDIVSPLGRAGIRCVVAVGQNDPARFSRHVHGAIDKFDQWVEPEAYVERLVEWADTQPVPPVLYYPTDGDLLMVSRYRDRLCAAFTFIIPDAQLIEDLVDKERFRKLAERLELPVPPSWHLSVGADLIEDRAVPLSFPVIVKPLSHFDARLFMNGKAKVFRADSAAELRSIRRQAGAAGAGCLVQALVPGPETRVESYHCFVDDAGATVVEFTGEKLRTEPFEYGESTAVSVGQRADVLEVGRRVVAAIELRSGAAKVDFKRGADGRLWLLEVNPRFNLWHNPGAAAGANIPAAYYAHLTGRAQPRGRPFQVGTTWCDLRNDRRAAVNAGIARTVWLRFAIGSATRASGDWDDPMPLLRGIVAPALRRRLGGSARVRSAG